MPSLSTCPICGSQFTKKYNNQKYCSDICASAGKYAKELEYSLIKKKRRKKAAHQVSCPVCGELFFKSNNNQKYCSKECAKKVLKKASKKSNKAKSEEKIKEKSKIKRLECVICGKTFMPKRKNQQCCSKVCQYEKSKRDKRKGYWNATRVSNTQEGQRDREIEFLNLVGNRYCSVAKDLFDKELLAIKIYNRSDKEEDKYNTKKWLAVSSTGYNWLISNPEEAKRLGYKD